MRSLVAIVAFLNLHQGLSNLPCLTSRSQFGEEATLIEWFGWNSSSSRGNTYVEIGALDGLKYSNTLQLASCYGWLGILVEGSPESASALHSNAPTTRGVAAETHHGAVCSPPRTTTLFSTDGDPQVSLKQGNNSKRRSSYLV